MSFIVVMLQQHFTEKLVSPNLCH